MTPFVSSPRLLTLHALRLKGMGDAGKVARRFLLDRDEVSELLLDFEAYGWVYPVEFAGAGGWTLSEAGSRTNGSSRTSWPNQGRTLRWRKPTRRSCR